MRTGGELHELEITEIAPLIQRREVSPVELTEAMLARIDRLDRDLHAFAAVMPDRAREQARRAEERIARRQYLGPLHGVPIALKDLCFTKGVPTAAGMPLMADFVPGFDGTVVRRLQDAGAIVLGKLQLTEGAFTEHHPDVRVPVNPWRDDTWSGASSSGSGVAVAARLAFGAIGSDTGGSIRFPSAANGVTGLKPTWGRVSRHGSFALADSLDHLGPMCRSAADCGLLLAEMAGPDPADPMTAMRAVPDMMAGWPGELTGVRIGIDAALLEDGTDTATRTALLGVQRVFDHLRASLVAVRMPQTASMVADWPLQCAVEAALTHQDTFPSQRHRYGPTLAAFLDLAEGVDARQIQAIWRRRQIFRGELEAVLRTVDAVLIPVQPDAGLTITRMAALGEDPAALDALVRHTAPYDMSGHPTITLPIGFTDAGAPIACQLLARHWAEDRLVLLGRAFQQATDHHRRRPPRA